MSNCCYSLVTDSVFSVWWLEQERLNDLMESKGGKKKSSSSSSSSKSIFYEAPLGYSIEDIRPNGGIKKFRSAAYSNVSIPVYPYGTQYDFGFGIILGEKKMLTSGFYLFLVQCARKPS